MKAKMAVANTFAPFSNPVRPSFTSDARMSGKREASLGPTMPRSKILAPALSSKIDSPDSNSESIRSETIRKSTIEIITGKA